MRLKKMAVIFSMTFLMIFNPVAAIKSYAVLPVAIPVVIDIFAKVILALGATGLVVETVKNNENQEELAKLEAQMLEKLSEDEKEIIDKGITASVDGDLMISKPAYNVVRRFSNSYITDKIGSNIKMFNSSFYKKVIPGSMLKDSWTQVIEVVDLKRDYNVDSITLKHAFKVNVKCNIPGTTEFEPYYFPSYVVNIQKLCIGGDIVNNYFLLAMREALLTGSGDYYTSHEFYNYDITKSQWANLTKSNFSIEVTPTEEFLDVVGFMRGSISHTQVKALPADGVIADDAAIVVPGIIGDEFIAEDEDGKAYVTDIPLDSLLNRLEGAIEDIDVRSASATSDLTATDVLNKLAPSDVTITDWTNKFPFCIPFDFARAFESLASPRVTPYWEIPFKIETFGIDEVIIVDFTMFNEIAKLCRYLTSVGFTIFLIMKTKDLIQN